jgi:hypothetical protein
MSFDQIEWIRTEIISNETARGVNYTHVPTIKLRDMEPEGLVVFSLEDKANELVFWLRDQIKGREPLKPGTLAYTGDEELE